MLKQITSFVAAIAFSTSAFAGATYGFTNVTNNNSGDVLIGINQLCVEVIDKGSNSVEFYFTNVGSDSASMVQLYWEDKTNVLSSVSSWSTTTPTKAAPNYGVDFSGGSASPGHLPGSNPKIDDFSIQAKSQGGKSKNGVGTGENVSIFFSTNSDYTALLAAIDNGDLIIGTHVQAFASGGSESFIAAPKGTPPTGVPSPSAAIAGLGLMGLLVSRRGRRK